MKNAKIIFVLFFGLVFQVLGQNTYDFLQLDSSPRASALGGAYVADIDDPNIIFYNPAGITNIDNIPISFSFLKHQEEAAKQSETFVSFTNCGRGC